jgi:ribosomal protein S18 acetylase RimI-like enzyme
VNVHVTGPETAIASICEPILRSLPDWFGIESAIVQYVQDIDRMQTFRAVEKDETVGFLTINRHFVESAEIHVMAVAPKFHRQGIGRELVTAAERWLQSKQCQFLQVKTLSESRKNEHYASTRAFYSSVGFVPLEELKTLWHEANPCLLMIKALQQMP